VDTDDRQRMTETPRQAIRRHLAAAPHTAHELSALVHLPEKEIVPHLEHLARSLRGSGGSLEIEPARCSDCGYVFRERRRLSKPSACPRCRGQHLRAPVFRLAAMSPRSPPWSTATRSHARGGDGRVHDLSCRP
jgi:predicted Zn-ribbon and HTH transcriptional regulator